MNLNRSLNDWKISDLLHALKETFSLRRDLAINEDEDNHPEYLHHPQAVCYNNLFLTFTSKIQF
ncbi:hypothetical protein Avbf_15485 [Armadillidium vulgare]|nr:hypothetical protein Avbf_15485 [Armadillidium vulgare]